MDIKGKVAIITGGGRGIGKSISLRLAQEGAQIVINYYAHEKEAKTLRDFVEKTYGIKALVCKADVSRLNKVEKMVQMAVEYFGRIDILVNNAGVKAENCDLSSLPKHEWDRVIDTNLTSVFNTCKVVLPYMIKQREGVIINNASIVALMGASVNVAYAASKAGVVGFSLALAAQVSKYNIRVNVLAPGAIDTSWWDSELEIRDRLSQTCPLRRLGRPEEVAEAVVFLIHNDFINGVVLPIDGGRYAMKNVYHE
jgi:NAD(P)-dependent dehydrogenase (short-subunit alcohol dehydrogenase family)